MVPPYLPDKYPPGVLISVLSCEQTSFFFLMLCDDVNTTFALREQVLMRTLQRIPLGKEGPWHYQIPLSSSSRLIVTNHNYSFKISDDRCFARYQLEYLHQTYAEVLTHTLRERVWENIFDRKENSKLIEIWNSPHIEIHIILWALHKYQVD